MKQKNNAYSILDENNSVLNSFYADCNADAYVDAYLHTEKLGHGALILPNLVGYKSINTIDDNNSRYKLVHQGSLEHVYCPFSDDERVAIRLAAKFCSTMGTLASFRAMRSLATTMRVSRETDMRCVHVRRLVVGGYTVRHEFGVRRFANGRDFFFEKDLTKTALDFAEWLAVNQFSEPTEQKGCLESE